MAALGTIVTRVKRQLDLDADVEAIDAQLGQDPVLAPLVAAWLGLRVPGAWDPFELAIRAILGQQVSVAAATNLAGRTAALDGEPLRLEDGEAPPGLTYVFPSPAQLVSADAGVLRMPRSRAATIAGLAAAIEAEPGFLKPFRPLDEQYVTERVDEQQQGRFRLRCNQLERFATTPSVVLKAGNSVLGSSVISRRRRDMNRRGHPKELPRARRLTFRKTNLAQIDRSKSKQVKCDE